MLRFLLLVPFICEVLGGQKTSEIHYDKGNMDSLNCRTFCETALEFEEDVDVNQGDILLHHYRNAVKELWPKVNGTLSVAYKIDVNLESRTGDVINALKMISDETCVTFHPHTSETDYLYFSHSQGCASYVGYVGGEQPVLVGPQCNAGNICHEILHSLGLLHEHTRHDRGNYINILFENIIPGKEDNFLDNGGNTLGLKYDLESIMHYGSYYFSHNGKPTILSKNGTVIIGQRIRMTELDVMKIRRLYHCDK